MRLENLLKTLHDVIVAYHRIKYPSSAVKLAVDPTCVETDAFVQVELPTAPDQLQMLIQDVI